MLCVHIYIYICIDMYSFIGVHRRCYLCAARCDRAVVGCNTCLDASILSLFLFVDFEWWDVRVVWCSNLTLRSYP